MAAASASAALRRPCRSVISLGFLGLGVGGLDHAHLAHGLGRRRDGFRRGRRGASAAGAAAAAAAAAAASRAAASLADLVIGTLGLAASAAARAASAASFSAAAFSAAARGGARRAPRLRRARAPPRLRAGDASRRSSSSCWRISVGLRARFFLAADAARLPPRRQRPAACSSVGGVVALDEGALLAHFDLDGAGLAARIRLLDLAGRLAGQRDLLALAPGGAVRVAQVVEQPLLVCVVQRVVGRRLGDACGLQLFEQRCSGAIQLRCKLGDGGHCHFRNSLLVVPGVR